MQPDIHDWAHISKCFELLGQTGSIKCTAFRQGECTSSRTQELEILIDDYCSFASRPVSDRKWSSKRHVARYGPRRVPRNTWIMTHAWNSLPSQPVRNRLNLWTSALYLRYLYYYFFDKSYIPRRVQQPHGTPTARILSLREYVYVRIIFCLITWKQKTI
jgi:hypothetical protein